MGEALKKATRRAAFVAEHPYCCYCGGGTSATTVDHVPSRQMFSLRRRPKGLEVPACAPCNQATRQYEQVAAMFGRVYPDSSVAAEQDELRRIMNAVFSNVPGLLEELKPSARQRRRIAGSGIRLPDVGGALNCGGPILNRCIQKFGAKLGFALQYHEAGLIVPAQGGVAVRWFTNFDSMMGNIPSLLFQLLGEPKTLRQGKWSANDQFEYAYALSPDNERGAYFSTFRRSFAVLSWVCMDRTRFQDIEHTNIHRPGGL